MTTVELDMRRMELIRDIMDTDSIEVLDKVKRAFKRAVKSVQTDTYGPVPGIPHTIEEVKADIAEFEREWDEGTLVTYTTEEVMDEMRALIKSL